MPESLIPPAVLPGFEDWFDAFHELSTDRQIGNIIGPIPAGAIARHVDGWCNSEASLFRRVIRAMDAVYLRHLHNGGLPEVESDNPARDTFRAAMRAKQ